MTLSDALRKDRMAGLAGLVLAAGASTRMGANTNKLVEEVSGRPLVAWAVDAMIEAGLEGVYVVVGYEEERIREALRDRACLFVSFPDWREGMGSSLGAGVRRASLDASLRGLFVSVGDLPGLRAEIFLRMAETLGSDAAARDRILVPVARAGPGHPVLFGAAHFSALTKLRGDRGGRPVIEANAANVTRLALGDEAVSADLDSPSEFARFRGRATRLDSTGNEPRADSTRKRG